MRKILKLVRNTVIITLILGFIGMVTLIVCTPSISFKEIIGGQATG